MNPQTLAPTAQPPHPLEGLVSYPFYTYAQFWAYLGLGLGLLLALVFFYRRYRQRRALLNPALPGCLNSKPEQLLLQLSQNLAALVPPEPFTSPLVQQDYFFRLNMLLREILETAWGLPATDLTLAELEKPLAEHQALTHTEKEGLEAFLKRSELIKFAAAETTLSEAQESHRQARLWCAAWLEQQRLGESSTVVEGKPHA